MEKKILRKGGKTSLWIHLWYLTCILVLISQLTSSKIKKQIETFEICFILHFLIISNKDANFFQAIQKPHDKDFLKNKITKKKKIL